MDKQLLERVSVGIQVLGYGLIIHSLFLFTELNCFSCKTTFYEFTNYPWENVEFREGQILYLIMCLVVPIFLRWMLTGNFHIIPLTHNYLKELNKPMRDSSEKG